MVCTREVHALQSHFIGHIILGWLCDTDTTLAKDHTVVMYLQYARTTAEQCVVSPLPTLNTN